jgi:hypothetical protein
MRIKVRVQRHLAVGHIDGDDGEWIFTVCRSGLQELVGHRLETGKRYTIDLSGEVITDENDEAWLKTWLRDEPETD